MRILTRYILREVTAHALIGAAVFTFVVFMRDLGRLLELVVRNSAPLPSVAEIFFFTLPTALTVTIPMGVLVGILIGLSRLAADSEITAMRASGIGAGTFVKILSLFIGACWLLALVNNVWVAPRSAAALGKLQDRLRTSQASFEIQPRVFYEDFRDYVLYVEDVSAARGAAIWKGVFLADLTNRTAPKVTMSERGVVVNEGNDRLRLHLENGAQYEFDPRDPSQNLTSTFQQSDIPLPMPAAQQQRSSDKVSAADLPMRSLLPLARASSTAPEQRRTFLIEVNRRLALPTACVVLALVGIPLGLSAKKGGKSTGFVLTIGLVFLYYFLSLAGMSLARQGKISPAIGLWMGNLVFFVGGVVLLWRVESMPMELASARDAWNRLKTRLSRGAARFGVSRDVHRPPLTRRLFNARFPLLLDDLILRDFLVYLGMIVGTFLVLLLVFTFFELLGDIVRNRVPLVLVGEYLVNVTPYFLYNTIPISVLLSVLVTFGLMQKANEITAMKATGISIYRAIVPVLVIAAILAAGLFFFDQFYLPYANKRQDALRNQIKGKPAQTYLRPDRKWIFGERSNIYYYQFFDPDQNRFGNVSVYEFDPKTFEMTRQIYAERAHWSDTVNEWIFERGWERDFQGTAIANFRAFDVSTSPELRETPAYFKKEVKQSQEMNAEELRRYISDLQRSGFDVVRLRVQLQKKFAFPIITFVMAVLAIPFALRTGRRGPVAGVATAIGVAVVYWVIALLFEGLGNTSQLPPFLAAWSPDLIFGLAGGYLILKVPT